jgi:NADPH-dependent 2,4-dienoyl-CoA reductase/sulfur reductase-like enzyme/nitrite reductase/ring-hydroxylating ferredoxin subunit
MEGKGFGHGALTQGKETLIVMSKSSSNPGGPDLRAGVPRSELKEGEPIFGHVGEDPVFLVLRGREIRAYDGKCTHYGGPLSDGIIVGGTIRCPWHHACFSLEDGGVEGGPAFNPLRQWEVSEEVGKVRVGDRIARDPLVPRRTPRRHPDSVIIVGAGAAGSSAAETLRTEGYDGPVKLVDPDPDAPYDRPNLSKDYLAGKAPEEWIPLRSREFLEDHDIQRLVAPVRGLDLENHFLTLEGDERIPFGALLLATGSRPRRLQVPGGDRSHVHTLRSLEDSRSIIQAAEKVHRVVVVGASFIGMEAAASLRMRGLEVTVAAPEKHPFEKTLGKDLGGFLRSVHEEHGVRFRMARRIKEVREEVVVLDDGTELPADLVVVGIGVDPELELARQAGLQVEDGIVVDEYLRTSHTDVFAAGDVALYPEPRTGRRVRIEHWAVARRQGRTAARNILGREEALLDVPFFWTEHYGVPVAYVGHGVEWDEAIKKGACEDGGCAVVFRKNGRRQALATVYRDEESLRAEAEMEEEALSGRSAS